MNEAIPVLIKLAKRFEAMADVHEDIVKELSSSVLLHGVAMEGHSMKAQIFKEIADALRGTVADLRNNVQNKGA